MLRRLPRLLLPRQRLPRAALLRVLRHWRATRGGRPPGRAETRLDGGRLAVIPGTTTWPAISGAMPGDQTRQATAARLAPPGSRRQRLIAAWRAARCR